MSHNIQYFNEQVGGGVGVKSVHAGASYQRGSGIGSFFGSTFRRIAPYFARGAKAVGKEAVRAGLNVIDDVANNGAHLKEALNDHLKELDKNLKNKAKRKLDEMMTMSGNGYIVLVAKRKRQSKKSRAPVRNAHRKTKSKKHASKKASKKVERKKKRKSRIRSVTDIFGP